MTDQVPLAKTLSTPRYSIATTDQVPTVMALTHQAPVIKTL